MGVIQNAVNQMIGTTALAARLAPGYETKQELHQLNKQSKQIEAAKSKMPKDILEGTAAEEQLNEFQKQKLKVLQRQQELKPTREGMLDLVMQRSLANKTPIMIFGADADEIKQEQAMMEVAVKQEAALKLRRNFMNYLRKEPIAGGGTVGDLPISVLKQIATTYSKSDRKKLMDRGDSK